MRGEVKRIRGGGKPPGEEEKTENAQIYLGAPIGGGLKKTRVAMAIADAFPIRRDA